MTEAENKRVTVYIYHLGIPAANQDPNIFQVRKTGWCVPGFPGTIRIFTLTRFRRIVFLTRAVA
jgi:hypothetical protein